MVGTVFCFLHRNARMVIVLTLVAGLLLACGLVLQAFRYLHGV